MQTRTVAGDITAGALAAFMGAVVLSQFTPGSIAAGTAIAQAVGREQAISEFVLGDPARRLF